MYKFGSCETIWEIGTEERSETMVKFCKIVAMKVILYDSKSWTAKERDWTRRQKTEKIFF
jgi:hypothetical protein